MRISHRPLAVGSLAIALTGAATAYVIPSDDMATTTVTNSLTETVIHTPTDTVTSWALREPGSPPPDGDWEKMGPCPGEQQCTDYATALHNDDRTTTNCELRDGQWYFYLATDDEPAESDTEESDNAG